MFADTLHCSTWWLWADAILMSVYFRVRNLLNHKNQPLAQSLKGFWQREPKLLKLCPMFQVTRNNNNNLVGLDVSYRKTKLRMLCSLCNMLTDAWDVCVRNDKNVGYRWELCYKRWLFPVMALLLYVKGAVCCATIVYLSIPVYHSPVWIIRYISVLFRALFSKYFSMYDLRHNNQLKF